MNDSKQNKTRGRHAAPAQQSNGGSSKPVPAASNRPADATAVIPPVAAGVDKRPPSVQAVDSVFSPNGPVRPVDPSPMGSPTRKHRPLKIMGIALGVIVALVAAAYIGVSVYFTGHFMPNTSIGKVNVSLMSSSDAQRALADSVGKYKLSISGQGLKLDLTASDAGLSIDEGKVVKDALADVNPWLWPLELRKSHDETAKLVATYNETGLEDTLRSAVDAFNATATQPKNATISYSEAESSFVVVPEVAGTAIDADAVMKEVDAAVVAFQPSVKLSSDSLLKPSVLSTDEHLVSAAKAANTMISADLVLTMAGTTAGEVGPDLVSQWVTLDADLKATLDEAALTAWVDQLAASLDTVGSQRTYTRPDGKVITVAGGTYGWEVDHDALLNMVKEGVSNGTVDTVEVPTVSTGTGFNGVGARDWGSRYCDIDLAEQHVRFYDESGALVWESDCISGEPDGTHDTSTGVYWLNQKQSPSKLIGYENGEKIYESTVQYWMPFVGNAIGLHDADWQPDFGGTMYKDGYGSHGCVNLPPAKAAELYGIIQAGDVVVSHW